MSQTANIRRALSQIAIAYLLLHLDLNLGTLNVLPDWAGYLLIFSAIGQLSGELRDLPLLRPFCVLLGIVSGVNWLAVLATGDGLTGRLFLLNVLLTCIALYFHFQLLTDLARLAEGAGGAPLLACRLRLCRSMDAVLRVISFPQLYWWGEVPVFTALLPLFWLGVCAVIAVSLFSLRNRFPLEADGETP